MCALVTGVQTCALPISSPSALQRKTQLHHHIVRIAYENQMHADGGHILPRVITAICRQPLNIRLRIGAAQRELVNHAALRSAPAGPGTLDALMGPHEMEDRKGVG